MSRVLSSAPRPPAQYDPAPFAHVFNRMTDAINRIAREQGALASQLDRVKLDSASRTAGGGGILGSESPLPVFEFYEDAGTAYAKVWFESGWLNIDDVQYRIGLDIDGVKGGNIDPAETWLKYSDSDPAISFVSDTAFRGGGYYLIGVDMDILPKKYKDDMMLMQVRVLDAAGAVWGIATNAFDADSEPQVYSCSLITGNWDNSGNTWTLYARGRTDNDATGIEIVYSLTEYTADPLFDTPDVTDTVNAAFSFDTTVGTFAADTTVYVAVRATNATTDEDNPVWMGSITTPPDPFDVSGVGTGEILAAQLEDSARDAIIEVTGAHLAGFEDTTVRVTGSVTRGGTTYSAWSPHDVTPATTGLKKIYLDPGFDATSLYYEDEVAYVGNETDERILVGVMSKAATAGARCFFVFASGQSVITAPYVYAVNLQAITATMGALTVDDTLTVSGGKVQIGGTMNLGDNVDGGTSDGIYVNANNYWYTTGHFSVGDGTSGVTWNGATLAVAGTVDITGASDITAALTLGTGGKIQIGGAGGMKFGDAVSGANDGMWLDADNYWYTTGAFSLGGTNGIQYNLASINLGSLTIISGDVAISGGSLYMVGASDRMDIGPNALGANLFGISMKDATGTTRIQIGETVASTTYGFIAYNSSGTAVFDSTGVGVIGGSSSVLLNAVTINDTLTMGASGIINNAADDFRVDSNGFTIRDSVTWDAKKSYDITTTGGTNVFRLYGTSAGATLASPTGTLNLVSSSSTTVTSSANFLVDLNSGAGKLQLTGRLELDLNSTPTPASGYWHIHHAAAGGNYFLTDTSSTETIATAANTLTFTNKTWQGATIGILYGGTGAATAQAGRLALLPAIATNTLKVLRVNAGETDVEWAAASGGITGPGSSTDNAVARWDGAGGGTLQNSGFTVADSVVASLATNALSLGSASGANNQQLLLYTTSTPFLALTTSHTGDMTIAAWDTASVNTTLKFRTATAGTEADALYIDSNQKLWIGSTADTNLYRSAANTLKTDDNFVVGGTSLTVNSNSVLAPTGSPSAGDIPYYTGGSWVYYNGTELYFNNARALFTSIADVTVSGTASATTLIGSIVGGTNVAGMSTGTILTVEASGYFETTGAADGKLTFTVHYDLSGDNANISMPLELPTGISTVNGRWELRAKIKILLAGTTGSIRMTGHAVGYNLATDTAYHGMEVATDTSIDTQTPSVTLDIRVQPADTNSTVVCYESMCWAANFDPF